MKDVKKQEQKQEIKGFGILSCCTRRPMREQGLQILELE